MNDRYVQLLSANGISLDRLGIREVALRRDDALAAIQFLSELSVPILGGDVYYLCDGDIEFAYANWYTDPRNAESRNQFADRSCLKSKDFVAGFPETGKEALFVLVPLFE